VRLTFAGGWVHAEHDDRSYRSPLDGEPAPGQSPDGRPLRVSHRYERGRLVETLRSKRSTVRVILSLSEDAQELRCAVSISDDRLPAEIRYRLRFRRVP
jgi:hypothetical protein